MAAPSTSRGRRLRSGLTTLVSVALTIAALAILVAGMLLAQGPEADDPADAATSSAAARGTYHVDARRDRCSDSPKRDGRRAGRPWCTPGRALRSVPPGAVVALAPGRYPPLTIDRSTRPRGAVTFRAAGRRRPTVAKVTVAGVRRVAIERLRLPGGLAVLSASGVRARGNDLPGHGIYVRTSDGVEILRNRIHDLEGEKRGLLAQGFADGRRKGNRRIVVRGNRFERLQHDAIAFYNGYDRARVQGNTISDVVQPAGFPLHSDAMQFMGGKRLVLRDNVVRDSTHGILVKDGTTTGLAVSGNLVFGIDGAGLQVFNGPGTRIRRNTIWDVKDGVLLQNDARVAGRTTAVLENNVLEQLIVAPDARIPRARGNLFGRGRTFGAPSYQGTPRFRDAEEGDYRLAGDPGAGIPAGEEPGADRRAR